MKQFEERIWLATPTMHGEEKKCVDVAFDENYITTDGDNVRSIERIATEKVGCKHAVALSSGTAAIHLAVKLAGEQLYGKPELGKGALYGKRVFCSDMTFHATVEPVIYEGGIPVYIDTEYDTWNMCPRALEKAFELYPDTKIILMVNLYGTPAKLDEICAVANKHGAIVIEDAAESLGATYKGIQTGTFGSYNAISYNGNKIITGSTGGMLLTNDLKAANKARKWSTQSREAAPWYQHEEVGYNYRMSNIVAGIVRGQFPYLDEHISQKKVIYERYKEGFKDLPVKMNPYQEDIAKPNYWLSCLIIDKEAMCRQVRSDKEALYISEPGKSCPTEILETLAEYNVESRPIWKPMHLQPLYQTSAFITREGNGRGYTNAYIEGKGIDVSADIFDRGLCLPSDIKMTAEQQDMVIEIVKSCFE